MLGSRPNMFANLRTVSWNLRNLTYVLLHDNDGHIIIGPFLKIAKSRTSGMGFVMIYMTVPGLHGLQKFTKCQ